MKAAASILRLALILLLLLVASPVVAQTRPATGATGVESQPVVQRARPTASGDAAGGVNWTRLTLAMVVVLGLILALRYGALWLFPLARGGNGGRGVRVLGRTPIAPRQQVLLLHVGRRVLVVGDSAGTLSSLASIEAPDEVAELLGQVSGTSPTAVSKFKSLFGRAESEYDGAEPLPPDASHSIDEPADANVVTDPRIAQAQDDISGLLTRMRSLTKNVKR